MVPQGTKTTTPALPQQKQWVELQLLCRGNVGKTRILHSLLGHYQKISPQLQQQALPTVPDITLNIPRSIDLIQLYEEVVDKGGYEYVTMKKKWSSIGLTMKLKIEPEKLKDLYQIWLYEFENQQIHGNKRKEQMIYNESIATHTEVQLTTSIRQTPLPVVTKRLKTHRQQLSDLGILHRLVLGLDSNLEDHMDWALNQLTVLSYGSRKETDCDLLIAHVPGLLDALIRQIRLPSSKWSFFASVSPVGVEESAIQAQPLMQLEHTCRVYNVIRNLSMIQDNESAIANHPDFLKATLDVLKHSNTNSHQELEELIWDVMCQVAKVMKDLESSWLTYVIERFIDIDERRTVILRAAETLCHWMGSYCDRIKQHSLFQQLLARTIECTSRNRQDDMMAEDNGSSYPDVDDDEDGDDDGTGGADDDDDLSTWPALWEANYSSSSTSEIGADMGIVFASRHDGEPSQKKIDQEVRDRVLMMLFYLSRQDESMQEMIARHPMAMKRFSNVISSCVNRAESARLVVGVLSNLAMNSATLAYFLPIERELATISIMDPSLSGMIANIMTDVYGMNSLN